MFTSDHQTQWGRILLLWAAGLAAAMQFAKFSISLDGLAEHYGLTSAQVSPMLSAIGIVGVFLGVSAGSIVSQLGVRRSLLIGLLLGAAGSAIQTAMPPYGVMLASRLLEGVAHLFIVVAAPTAMIQNAAVRFQPLVMGLWATFFGVAYAVAGWWGIPLLETYGVDAVFGLHAGVMIALAIAMFWAMPADGDRGVIQIPWRPGEWLSQHRTLYTQAETALPGLAFFWHTLMFVALLTFLPQFAIEPHQHVLATVLPLLSIGASLLAGPISQWGSSATRGLVVVLIALLPLATLVWLSVGTGIIYSVAVCALMIASGLVQGGVFSMIPRLCATQDGQAKANGAVAQMGNLGASLGTPIFALAIQGADISGLTLVTLLLSVGAIVTVTRLGNRVTAQPRLTPSEAV